MPTASALSTRERVEAASREAHYRVILEALNLWLRDPSNSKRRKALTRYLDKYRDAAGKLFPLSNYPAFTRHGAAKLPPGELEEAIRLLSMLPKNPLHAPPWE